jgi:hypothetical protein
MLISMTNMCPVSCAGGKFGIEAAKLDISYKNRKGQGSLQKLSQNRGFHDDDDLNA